MTVIGGMSIHLFGGIVYLWGSIAAYVVSYYHYKGDKNASIANAAVAFTVSNILGNGTMIFGAFLLKFMHPTSILTLGSAIMLTSIYFASIATTWWTFFAFYAV